jgi:hypothetical protein
LEKPNHPLQYNIKIFNFGNNWASYEHLIGWSEIDKFSLSGIDTQNLQKIVIFNPKLHPFKSLFCRRILAKLDVLWIETTISQQGHVF